MYLHLHEVSRGFAVSPYFCFHFALCFFFPLLFWSSSPLQRVLVFRIVSSLLLLFFLWIVILGSHTYYTPSRTSFFPHFHTVWKETHSWKRTFSTKSYIDEDNFKGQVRRKNILCDVEEQAREIDGWLKIRLSASAHFLNLLVQRLCMYPVFHYIRIIWPFSFGSSLTHSLLLCTLICTK